MLKEIKLALGGLNIGFGIAELVQTIRSVRLLIKHQELEKEKTKLTLQAIEEERKLEAIRHELVMAQIQREGEEERERLHQEHMENVKKLRSIIEAYEKNHPDFPHVERN